MLGVLQLMPYGACAGGGAAVRCGLLVCYVSHLGAQFGLDAVAMRGAGHEGVQPAAAAAQPACPRASSLAARRRWPQLAVLPSE